MKYAEALKISQSRPAAATQPFTVALACGCADYHLAVFLNAHLRARFPQRDVRVSSGLYGDVVGNIQRLGQTKIDAAAVVLEWADLDPRLGLRHVGSWSPSALPDILASAESQAARLVAAIVQSPRRVPVAVSLPCLSLPPVAYTPGWRMSELEVRLHSVSAGMAAQLITTAHVRLLNPQRLDAVSPSADRRDVKSELLSGSPYRLAHASALTEQLATLLQSPTPKKGLITDLDNTLWRGLLGEEDVEGVSWDLDRRSHAHALYQQLLQSLADAGVLVAVASKNDAARVEKALRRDDLHVRHESLFPIEAHWEPKSLSVGRILRAWNVAADSVVFVDDSRMEIEEVKAAFPTLETFLFPTGQDQDIYDLLVRLRDLFGKPSVRAEDRLRLQSLRVAGAFGEAAGQRASSDDFLRGAEAEITLDVDREPPDPRALELVNKTNQFNLNGRRFTESEWAEHLNRADSFYWLISYRDKFGPLGKIAVLAGRCQGSRAIVDTWVLSCRAFSRRIEHQCLEILFREIPVEELVLDFTATARNGPLQEFLAGLLDKPLAGPVRLTRQQFATNCPPLYHHVKELIHG
jgi:FkbH-like protein